MPSRFSFLPARFISCPQRYFLGRMKLFFLAGKNVEICDFRQKKPSDFGEDLQVEIFLLTMNRRATSTLYKKAVA